MADDRLSRFKNLEKGRREDVAAPATASSGRFGALEQGKEAPAEAPSAPLTVERFTPGQPPPGPVRSLEDARRAVSGPSGLEIAEVKAGDQPFIRCARCQTDNHAVATACGGCGTNLNTPEQAAFNEALWARLRAPAEAPAPGVPPPPAPANSALAGKLSGLSPDQQRQVAEAIARDVAEQTRRRLGGTGLRARRFELVSPEALLAHFPPPVRLAMLGTALAVPALMMAFRPTRPMGFFLFLVTGMGLLRSWLAR